MLNLSLNELKLIAKSRSIKGYKSMSEDRLVSALNASELVKESENNFDDTESTKNKYYDPNEDKDKNISIKEFNDIIKSL